MTTTIGAEPVTIKRVPTSFAAWRQQVLLEPFVGVGEKFVQATLTSDCSPLFGQTVSFSDGSTPVYSAPTNS